MGAKILEAVGTLGRRIRSWLPWRKKEKEPIETFYVVWDDVPDDQPMIGSHLFNIRTGDETESFGPFEPRMIPPEKRMKYSEYLRIRKEFWKRECRENQQPSSEP